MEERAQVPPGLPRPNPTQSYWQTPPSPLATHRTTPTLPTTADYIIIGSGISGAFIAHTLLSKNPSAHVLMLEARQACSGATGRNGGHTKAASYRSFLDHEREWGIAEAVKIARMEHANVLATHAFAREHGIECASTPCDTVDIIYSSVQVELGEKAIARMRETMGEGDPAAQYRIWSAEEARGKFLCPGALAAFQYPAGSLSAYAFTLGVLQLAVGRGLDLQTETPAESINRAGGEDSKWTVRTPRGSITTPNLILATNGYTAHLLPSMQGLIVPLHGQVVAQRPGSGLPQTAFPITYSFIQETGYEYMITRPPGSQNAGDVIIGGGLWRLPNSGATRYGNTDDTVIEPTIRDYLRSSTASYFAHNWGSDHPDGRIKQEWSGVMGASADGLPYVGAVPDEPGLWVCAAFNGHGMVWCLKAAEAVVEMMVGDVEQRRVLEGWFPGSARLTRERMRGMFRGRRDLRAPGEGGEGRRSRL